MRSYLAGLAALAVLVSGCISSSAPQPLDPGSLAPEAPAASLLPEGIPASFATTGCTEMVGVFPAPMDVARAAMPEGFAPQAFDPAGLTAVVFAIGFTCAGSSGADLAEGEQRGFFGAWGVVAPEAYLDENITYYGVPFGMFVTDERLVEILGAWGMPNVGATDIGWSTTDLPAGRLGHVEGSTSDATVAMDVVAQGSPGVEAPGLLRLFLADEGHVHRAIDFRWTEGIVLADGQAVVTTGLGFPPAQPGFGLHIWGETYGYDLAFVDLSAMDHHAEDAGGAPAPSPRFRNL